MSPRYIELDDISHLHDFENGDGTLKDRLWRESYYFNLNDEVSGYSLITTIGILQNRSLVTGFFLLIKDGSVLLIKPLIKRTQVVFSDYSFSVKGLSYSIEGINWRLRYNSKKIKFDILFSPINKIYQYINDSSDLVFSRIGSQHYEQFGKFEGELSVNGKITKLGPCFGHRDHSWGVRDWGSVDNYRLFCAAFSSDLAINLWEGSINGKEFVKGYIFNGAENVEIIENVTETICKNNSKEPKSTTISVMDANNQTYEFTSQPKVTVPVPPRKSVLYESVAEFRLNGQSTLGLSEYLYSEPNPINRFWIFLKLLNLL